MKASLLILALVFLSSCSSFNRDYFPEWKNLDSFEREWFSEHLHSAKEKPVSLSTSGVVYRFTWLRSFNHPVVVRVNCDNQCFLTAKLLSGAGGYSPGRIKKIDRRELTIEEINRLTLLASSLNKWDYLPNEEIVGMDGAQWVLEMVQNGAYRAWNIWIPSAQKGMKEYADLCLYLLSLTSFSEEKENIY